MYNKTERKQYTLKRNRNKRKKLDSHFHKSSDFKPFKQVWLIRFFLCWKSDFLFMCESTQGRKAGGKDGDIWRRNIWFVLSPLYKLVQWWPLYTSLWGDLTWISFADDPFLNIREPNGSRKCVSINSLPDHLLSFLATERERTQLNIVFVNFFFSQ